MLMPKKLHALNTAAQAIAPTTTLFNTVFALALFSPKAPAASMAAMSPGDKTEASWSEQDQTIDSVKPTDVTCCKVALQARLL